MRMPLLSRDAAPCSLSANTGSKGAEVISVAAAVEDSVVGGAAAVIAPAMRGSV